MKRTLDQLVKQYGDYNARIQRGVEETEAGYRDLASMDDVIACSGFTVEQVIDAYNKG